MRKLTKKSLDELAKIMPVIDENRQWEKVGGHKYFTPEGIFLGGTSFGDEIRVTSKESFQTMMSSSQKDRDAPIGSGLAECDSTVQWYVIDTIASGMGIDSVSLFSDPGGNYGQYSPTSGIEINASSPPFISGNYYDVHLTLVHEKTHKDNASKGLNNIQSERAAYKAMIDDPNFSKASPEFKSLIRIRYDYYK